MREATRFDDLLSGGSVCTTEDVLAEVLTLFSADTWLRVRAVETVREMLSDPAVQVFPQSHESFLASVGLYEARPDQGYSLTDAVPVEPRRSVTAGSPPKPKVKL